jgi:hypothetical protein
MGGRETKATKVHRHFSFDEERRQVDCSNLRKIDLRRGKGEVAHDLDL